MKAKNRLADGVLAIPTSEMRPLLTRSCVVCALAALHCVQMKANLKLADEVLSAARSALRERRFPTPSQTMANWTALYLEMMSNGTGIPVRT